MYHKSKAKLLVFGDGFDDVGRHLRVRLPTQASCARARVCVCECACVCVCVSVYMQLNL